MCVRGVFQLFSGPLGKIGASDRLVIPVVQTHGASNAKAAGSIPRECMHWKTCSALNAM